MRYFSLLVGNYFKHVKMYTVSQLYLWSWAFFHFASICSIFFPFCLGFIRSWFDFLIFFYSPDFFGPTQLWFVFLGQVFLQLSQIQVSTSNFTFSLKNLVNFSRKDRKHVQKPEWNARKAYRKPKESMHSLNIEWKTTRIITFSSKEDRYE